MPIQKNEHFIAARSKWFTIICERCKYTNIFVSVQRFGQDKMLTNKKAPRNGGAKFNCTNFFLKDMRCYMRQTNVFLFRYYFLMSHTTKKNLLNLNRCC